MIREGAVASEAGPPPPFRRRRTGAELAADCRTAPVIDAIISCDGGRMPISRNQPRFLELHANGDRARAKREPFAKTKKGRSYLSSGFADVRMMAPKRITERSVYPSP